MHSRFEKRIRDVYMTAAAREIRKLQKAGINPPFVIQIGDREPITLDADLTRYVLAQAAKVK